MRPISPAFEVCYKGGTALRVPPDQRILRGRTDWRVKTIRRPLGVPHKFYAFINHRGVPGTTLVPPHRVRTRRLEIAGDRIHRRAVFPPSGVFEGNLSGSGAKAPRQGHRDGDFLTFRKGESRFTILRGDGAARTKAFEGFRSGGLCCCASVEGIFKRRFLPGF